MNNDLISREALKEAIETYDKFACLPDGKLEPFRNLEHPKMFEPYVHLRDIRNAINNAPTIEPITNEDINSAINEGFKNGYEMAKVKFERPQGEWIEKVECRGCFAGDKTVYSYTCPFCGAKEFKKYPFCHCGAELRVKDELNNELEGAEKEDG